MTYSEVTALEASEALNRYRVIDVRQDFEFRGPLGCLEPAENVPLSVVKERPQMLCGDQPLLLVCRSGMRSGKACEILEESGCPDVTNLAGGMIGWNQASLPVRHPKLESLAALVEQIASWNAMVEQRSPEDVRAAFRQRLESAEVPFEAPTCGAVEDLIRFVGESLASAHPPDLELSLASFRRSLGAL